MLLPRCAALAWLAGLCLAGCSARGTSDPILVGQIAPLSGAEKARGEHARNGIDLAVEDANQDDHRIAGRPVNVIHSDSLGSPDTAQEQAVRLLTLNKDKVVALLGDGRPAELDRVVRAAQPYGVPIVTPGTLPPGTVDEYVFSATVGPADQGRALAHYAAAALKPAAVTVLTDSRSNAAAALADSFRKEMSKESAVSTEERTYQGDGDFAGLAAAVKKAAPTMVLVAGMARDVVQLRPQLHEAAPDAVFLLGVEEGGQVILAEDHTTAGTAYLASAFAAEGLTPGGHKLAQVCRDRFGVDLDAPAALAYDAARILFEAMRKERTTKSADVRRILAAMENFDSLTGPLALTKEHTARRLLFVLRLQQGRTELVRRDEPEAK
jgi:branched-chain amino acid transport system substrate-binding protein